MPLLEYLHEHQSQPTEDVGASDLARALGFQFLVNPAVPVNSITGRLLDRAGDHTLSSNGRLGLAYTTTTNGNRYTAPGAPTSAGHDCTLFGFVQIAAWQNYPRLSGTSNSTNGGVCLEIDGTDFPGRVSFVKSGRVALTSNITLSLGIPYCVAASYTHSSGSLRIVVVNLNTGSVSTWAGTDTQAFVTGDGTYTYAGQSWVGVVSLVNGQMGVGGVSLRSLTDDQIISIARDPWSLFAPQRHQVPYSSATSYSITADGATYAYTAGDTTLLFNRRLVADGATYSYSSGDAGLTFGRRLEADGATYAYSAGDATLVYTPAGSYTLVADGATYTLTAGDASLRLGRVLRADGAAYTYTAGNANLTYSGAQSAVAAEVWNYELAPGVTAGEMLTAIYNALTAGQVDANVTHIRGIPLVGTGVVGDEFGVMQ